MTSRDTRTPSQDEPEESATQEAGPSRVGQTSLSEEEVSSQEHSSSHESTRGPDPGSPYETQSSNVSDITLRPPHPQTIGGDERSVESDARNSIDHAESSGSLTFHPHLHDRVPDDSGSGSWMPSSPPARHSIVSQPEITEAVSSDGSQGEAAAVDRSPSEVSIESAIPETPTRRSSRPNSRKRSHFWLNLKRGSENLRKRLCCCFSPKEIDQESSSNGEGFKIRKVEMVDGILRSNASMNSSTSRHVEQVINDHGGLVVLSGQKLLEYEQRLAVMLETYFERSSGFEILESWKLDTARPQRLHVEMLPSSSTDRRTLTLGDVRLLSPPRDELSDRRDDSLFRYFMSYQGLSQRMLIPGRA